MRILLAILSLVLALFLLPYGGYYLLTQSPLLFHSYTQLSIFLVAIGFAFLAVSVICIYQRIQDSYGIWDILLAFGVFGLLVLGLFLYGALTSRVVEINTNIRIVGTFPVTTDHWTSPTHSFKPNQSLMVGCMQPFHVRIGDLEALSVPHQGRHLFFIETTSEDYFRQDNYIAVVKLAPSDKLQVRLAQNSAQKEAEVTFGVRDEDHTAAVREAQRIERDNFLKYLVLLLVVGGFIGSLLYKFWKDWSEQNEVKQAEAKREKERLEKEKKARQLEQERLDEEREAREAQHRAQEEEQRRKAEKEKFDTIVEGIDPDSLFKD